MNKYIFVLIAFIISSSVFAQKKVTGTVYDEENVPLPGATVVKEGTTNGTITDVNGYFVIENVNEGDRLVISFIGFESSTVDVGNKSNITVVLKSTITELDELVVVGYGTTKRTDLTGSVASIKTDDLAKASVSNFDQALAGRVAGLSITSVDGTPGEKSNIVIRGGNSITGDNSPLYVVDGMPLDDFDPATLNTNDIETFDILKDASATAIYGSRGANGVIIITTKKGRNDGKTDVRAGVSYRTDWIPTRLEVLSPYEFVKYQEMVAYAMDGYIPSQYVKYFSTSYVDPSYYLDSEGIDWQERVFRAAPSINANVNISGGNKNTSFYYSGEFLKQDGTLINTGFEKLINNLKIRHKINNKADIGAQLQYSYMNRKGLSVRGNSYTSVIRDVIRFRPVEPVVDDGLEEGGYDPMDPNYRYYFNPVKNLENTDRQYRSYVFRGGLDFKYKFTKELVLSMRGNYQMDLRKQHLFYGEDTQQGSRGNDLINGSVTLPMYSTLSTSNTLTYSKRKNGNKYSALIGVEAQTRRYEYAYMKNSQLPTDLLGIDNLGIGIAPSLPQTSASENRLLSYFTRINYDYKSRYLLTATFRADGSSKFKNNPWGYFPSFAAAWRVKEESFLTGLGWLSNAKIRAGWGLTGNNRIGDFESYNQLGVSTSSGYVWGNGEDYNPGVYLVNMGVPDLKWEKTAQTNVGLDLGFLNQRISANIDYYHKKTSDLLLDAEMALHTGFDKVQQNVGEVENKGLEIVINSENIRKKNFRWSSSFNISFNKNKVLALNAGQTEILTNPDWNYGYNEYQYVTRIGEPVGMIYGLQFDRIYQVSDFNYDNDTGVYQLKEGIPDNGNAIIAPGSIKFVDQNGDGTINSSDRVIIGDPHPKHFGGFSNTFEFLNGFDCQILFQWSYDFDILNANKAVYASPDGTFNGLSALSQSWTPYYTDTDVSSRVYQSVYGTAPTGNQIDSRFVEDGSYLKLKTMVVGYTLPDKLVKRIHIQKARIYVSGNNLYTWTNYSGYDPDVSVGKYGALTPNLDYSAYPQSSSVEIGIDINF
ncbi:SusC/RagA family TonB-linked outer membrane protein [Thermophagus sp. OGC60D27]|uniref:SusC/RagA family TonB-linked outer membrane protein n=1 Tax=Thermophagus sp. OGC60D27 TaxID=3458415 RepID=UPI004038462D